MMTKDLQKRVDDFVEMEQRFGNMQVISLVYVARCMQISIEEAAIALKEL